MRTHCIISDLHLADAGRRDDFKKNRPKFKSFLHFVRKQKARLIIAGDFLELWQASPVAIARAYSDILNELIALEAIIVIGNHDYYLTHFRELNFLYDSYQIPGTRIFTQHGHQFDRFNDPKRLIHIAHLAALTAGTIEEIYPHSDEKAMSFLKKLRKDLSAALEPFCSPGTQRKEYLARRGDFSEYLRGAQELLKKFRYVILGHTHEAGTALGGRYLNSGSWTSANPTYVEVTARGQCALKYWPTQQPVTKLLQLELREKRQRGVTKKPKIPQFGSDEAIAKFWDTHCLADYWDQLEIARDVKFIRPKTKKPPRAR